MGLTPEEKQKIYEEEKERLEAREKLERERWKTEGSTSTGLPPNVAGLLCYLGGWITGIIFLVLEQKNRWVRFHAAQSIVVFGSITAIGIALGWIPVVGNVFAALAGIAGFIFWLVLMVKAHNGERFKVGWAGEVAERMIATPGVEEEHPEPPAPPSEPPAGAVPPPPPPAAADLGKRIEEKVERHFKGTRAGRVAESSFAIAWSIVLLIFFNFFNQYVAYYHSEAVNGATVWTRSPFFTADISLWLPILTTTLIITIVGHIILIIFDKYALREIINIGLNAFGLATVVTLLRVFPFDFSVIPSTTIADATHMGVWVTLILVSIGIGIGMIVRFIKLIVHLVRYGTD